MLGLIAILLIPLWMLRPILNIVSHKSTGDDNVSFQITDVLSLFFLVQVIFGLLVRNTNSTTTLIVFSYVLIVATLTWLAGTISANKIGISQPIKRIVSTTFVFPASVASGFLTLYLAIGLVEKFENPNLDNADWGLLFVGILITNRLLVFWIVGPQNPLSEPNSQLKN